MPNKYIPASELNNSDYHASTAISKSGLDLIAKTPAHYYERYLRPDRVALPDSPALIFGSAFHTILESEDLFLEEYILVEKFDRRTKIGKAAAEEFESHANGKIILDPDDWDRLHRMRDKLYSRVSMRTLLEGGVEAEPSYYWDQHSIKTEATAEARCRPDLIATSRDYVLDFKTTVSAKREDFEKSCANYRYHVQAAWYLHGASQVTASPIQTFFFVAVEKEAPFAVQIFEAPIDFIRRGWELAQRDFDTYAKCLADTEKSLKSIPEGAHPKTFELARARCWPDYPDEISTLTLPPWSK